MAKGGSAQGIHGRWTDKDILEDRLLTLQYSSACNIELDTHLRYIICRGGTEFDVR